jgi:thiol-disulfide isomerase/thioredoxin
LRQIAWLVVYTGLVLGANTAGAADLQALRVGEMRTLVVHAAPQPIATGIFETPTGQQHTLADWNGLVVVLNFWATWCPPCRKEMPGLNALQEAYGADGLAVLPVATGRNSLDGIQRFYAEAGIDSLPILIDVRSGLARASGVIGLPVTLVIDRNGQEVARLTGEADWNGPDARRVIESLLAEAEQMPRALTAQ